MNITYGAIEAGGTKFVCATGNSAGTLLSRVQIPTTSPEETLARVIDFFRAQPHPLTAIGIGCFGPIDLHRDSPDYGFITTTPKLAWRNTDVVGAISRALSVPVAFDTDVNAAALGEWRWGAAQGLSDFIYLTIGTGIGGGGMSNGRLLHGLLHPEMGHVRIPHDRDADPFDGVCPSHGDCLEGLASGTALEARWRARAPDLPPTHPAWYLEARYLALGMANFVYTLSPQRIIAGGGLSHQAALFPMIRTHLAQILNGYIQMTEITERMGSYVVPPALGDNAGILGALALAIAQANS